MAEQNATNPVSTAIGEVQSVTGRVVAIGANGVERQLFAGDAVYPDDQIKTIGKSTIVVALRDGSRLDLGRDSEALLDEAVYSDDVAAVRASALADVEEIQKAIAEGADPAEITDPTAVGGDLSSGGESIEPAAGQERTGRTGNIEAGYETEGLAAGFNPLLADAIDFGAEGGGIFPKAPVVSISIDSVASDGAVDAAEGASAAVPIVGTVDGDVHNGDIVSLIVNGTAYQGPVAGGTFSIDVLGSDLIADSNVVASITVTNGFGVSAIATANADYMVDTDITAAPMVTISDDMNHDGLINAAEFSGEISVAVGLPAGAVAGDVISISDGYTTDSITLAPDDIVNGSVNTSFPSPGDGKAIMVTARLTDVAGNLSPTGSDSATLDTTAPTIDIDGVTGDNQVDDSEDGGVMLSGTSTGAVGQTVSVAIVDGSNTNVYAGTAVVQADGSWGIPNVDLSGLPDEAGYTVTADVSDAAGNAATQATEPFTTEDTTAPTIDIDGVTGDNQVDDSEDGSVTLSGTSTGAVGQTVSVAIVDGSNTNVYAGTAVVQADGSWGIPNVDLSGLPDEAGYTVTADVSDAAGNAATQATEPFTTSAANNPPSADHDTDTLALGLESSVSGNVLGNDTDPDGLPAPLTVSNPGTYTGNYGTLDLAADGTYTYTVDPAAAATALLGPVGDMFAHWTFDAANGNSVPDVAPNGNPNNVNLNGNVLATDGQIGGAAMLDGSSRLTMGNSSEINLGIHQQRTISLHFNADDVSGRQVLYEEGAQVRGLNIFIDNGNLFVGGWNTPNGESNWDGDWIDLGPVNAGDWNHVALVLDGGPIVANGALTAYLNGSPVGSAQGSQLWSHSGDVSIGGSGGNSVYPDGNSSAGYNFGGLIDDVRIYNTAVTAQDIAELAGQDGTLTDIFSYTATDGAADSNNAILSIVVDSVPPTAPVTADAAAAVAEDTPIVFTESDFPFTDANAGDTLQAVRIGGLPMDGALEYFDGSAWAAVTAGQVIDASDIAAGNLRFMPVAQESGSDVFGGSGVGNQQADYARFSYEVSDGGSFSNTATFTIDVTPVVDQPNLTATLSGSPTVTQQTLLNEEFNDSNATGWTAVDLGPNAILSGSQGTGSWVVENGVLEQNDPAGAEHTFMRYDSTPAIRALDSYNLSVEIDPNRSGNDLGSTNNAVGLVFGYTDSDNYYRVEWVNFSSTYAPGGSNANGYGGGELHKDFRLVRVQDGTETILTKTDVASISSGESFTLTLTVDSTLGIMVQAGGYSLSHVDTPLLNDFGLYSWDNDNDIGYDNVVLVASDYRYDLTIASDLVDLDGSETLTISVSNLPPDSSLSAGVENSDGTWSLNAADLPGLQVVSLQALADPALSLSATATETADGSRSSHVIALGGDGILVGGPGDDLFVGGAGTDEFVWNNGHEGDAGSPVVDRVTAFNSIGEGDALDIRNLLEDESQSNLIDYLHFEQDGQDAVVHISSSGGFGTGYDASAEDQTIILENVDLSGFATDQDIIDTLIAGNNLITD